ncbi:MAG TPA: oligosaccharide flippase family protein [Gaiellaceae bacterium]|nr:oligosaccharide flippase family protein [Gaiellaceae bacterium]
MASRLTGRRSTTAAGIYLSALLGFLATVVAARLLGVDEFALFAIVVAAVGLLQTLLDLTVEEALTKYGFRFVTAEEWGKLRRLFSRALLLKLAGAVLAGLALLALAPFADALFDADGLAAPLAIAALLPLVQAPEGPAATALLLRGRYDVRGGLLALSMALRLAGIAVGASIGVTEAVAGMVLGQVAATACVAVAGLVAFRRFPAAPEQPLAAESRDLRSFVLQSSLATGVVSLRTSLAPLLLGLVSPTVQVGYFRAALVPQQAFGTLSAPVRMILLTEQTRDWEQGRRERVFAGVRRYSAGAAAVTAVLLVPLLWLMPDLIRIVFGAEFVAATDAARLVLLAAVLQFVFGWTKSFPVTIGRPNLRVATHGLETLVLVPLTLVLGAAWGATGAAAALLVATVVFAAAWTLLFARVRRGRLPVPLPQ